MNSITLTKVTIADVHQLQEIGKQTFVETFSSSNSEENLRKYLEEELSIEKLTEELRNESSQFFFASFDNAIIGYLKLNFGESQTEVKDDRAMEIERIYVLEKFHGKSVGKILYQKAIEAAKEINAEYVWLGVWEENHRAINFYKKNGFEEFDKHIFKLGDDEQIDIMMKLKLSNA
jgi:ribosomal protein S18 acetylase RimI-like enzyme